MPVATETRATCPRCDFRLTSEESACPACGIVFERYEAAQQAASLEPAGCGGGYEPPAEAGIAWVLGGTMPPGVGAALMSPPQPLRWVANFNIAAGVMNLLLAGALVHFAKELPGEKSTVIISVLVGAASLWLGWATRRLYPAARMVLLVASFASLVAVPIGTVLGVLLLRYLSYPGMQVLFSGKDPDDLTPSEVEQLRELRDARSGVWFVRVVRFFLYLAVLGILAALVFGSLGGMLLSSLGQTRAISELKQLDYAIRDQVIAHEGFPPTQGVSALVRHYRTPISVVDPWGKPYLYERIDRTFRVGSAGPDGKWEHRFLSGYPKGEQVGDDIIVASGELLAR